ncbi:uncharacterized protein LOC131954311 [Physella acuta]|uniref:uncharacterized protein LOC131954311 n=1 Tax=Physella acuta TaxID=109671 RepID=UPI0027DD9A54|nr:uncharacterized protein LOC131954311 [Physella acuta]
MASPSRKNITLALIGRVGNGKSACGNSILGKVVFPTSDNSKSCTHEVAVELKTRIDCEVKVVDTPGFMDRDAVQDRENTVIRIPELMRICPEGVHAFCLVLKYGAVDIDKDKEAVKKVKYIFGENVLRDYGIIIMTQGDNFDLNNEREEEGVVPFQLWCKKQIY